MATRDGITMAAKILILKNINKLYTYSKNLGYKLYRAI